MPQPLRPTDSFNSSTATIVPDKRRADASSNRFYPSVPNSRTLVSTSSLEGHIYSALRVNAGGDDGMIGLLHTQTQDMGGNGLSGLSFMREFIHIPSDDNSQPTPATSQSSVPPIHQQTNQYIPQQPNHLGHSTFIPNTNTFEPIPSPHSAHSTSSFEPIPSPHANPFATLTSPVEPHPHGASEYFRPSSVASHHSHAGSSVDASEYYSTTDMDTDDDDLASINDGPHLAIRSNIGDLGMANIHLENNNQKADIMNWMNYQTHPPTGSISPNEIKTQSQVVSPNEMTRQQPLPQVPVASSSRPGRQAVSAAAGSSKARRSTRSTTGMTDEDKIKLDKLEHRRDINRRSAQKHRLQRKKDMENMTKLLAERDATIHQLQRDLEVEKARNDQLRILMNNRLANGGTGVGGN
ncbi:hypothetical protein I302_103851 [Kwoniella bestiolae CBS 10118]|uniref:BZIP domain-containing protein n=1 Tax=Kwoniella bestiolae CBS 10118 TaxID=1296100 RepID=A0A1B9G9M0_9TREE|nr:hypothetical protein I302_02554 [Kwoniella bestiolae CBS 10118]OCF27709.1 hypothetical protein I302_02554 [Kwoniella bestiolae CBS 10118]